MNTRCFKIYVLLFLSFLSVLNSASQVPEILKKFNTSSLGENVFVFDPQMNMKEIQAVLDTIFLRQTGRKGEFTNDRYAFLFKPGRYDLDIRVDYYMQVIGLGKSPDDVVIHGAIRSNTTMWNSVLCNFWRSVENIAVEPVRDTMIWGVSQAAPLRRIHVKGNLQLFDKGYASGGFLADSKIDGKVTSGPQQQWFTRNTELGKWEGGHWNMMFVGVPQAPDENWPNGPYTTIRETPLIREKPYLAWDKKEFIVMVPELKKNSSGPGWMNQKYPDKPIIWMSFIL